VAVAVVDGLEVVEVEQHERERVADAVRAAPLQRELLVESAPVREAGEAVERRLRGDAAEVAEHAHDGAREQERDQDQERERAEAGVTDALQIWPHVRVDRSFRAQREQSHARGVGHEARQATEPRGAEGDGPALGHERAAAEDAALPRQHEPVARRARRILRETTGDGPVQRDARDDLRDAAAVDREPDGAAY
jgi:hypothetical protein